MDNNKIEAENCSKLAYDALRSKSFNKALKLAQRAVSLCPCEEYSKLVTQIKCKQVESN